MENINALNEHRKTQASVIKKLDDHRKIQRLEIIKLELTVKKLTK